MLYVSAFLVVLDADSTLIQNEVIELLADEAGRGAEVAAATEAAMRGDVDFAESLRQRVAALEGVSVDAFTRVLQRITPTPGVLELTNAVHARGGTVAVVSGGFHEILDQIAPALGVDVWRANRLEIVEGTLTGATSGPIIDAKAKAAALQEWAEEFHAVTTYAIGDGANDLEMMKIATLGLAFNAKPAVRAAADIVVGPVDLSQVVALLPSPQQ